MYMTVSVINFDFSNFDQYSAGLFLLLLLAVALVLFLWFRGKSASRAEEEKTRSLLLKHKQLFDNLFSHPLTEEQRLSIVDDSYRTLVIASAGSGKTTTLIGKYAFLLKEGLATPREILVLAFNRDIGEEVKERIKKLVPSAVNPEVYTFHAFGLELLNRVEGKKRLDGLAKSTSDGFLDKDHMLKIIDKAKKKCPEIENLILKFKAECPYHQIEEFARNEEEYNEAVASYPYRKGYFSGGQYKPRRIPSLDKRYWVRSQQELTIINSLILEGVSVEYERKHPGWDIVPDFYYPEIDLWHEHIAIGRDGSSPFGKEYVSKYFWKKKFYHDQGKDCLFTYSYEYYEGTVLEKILKKLHEKGASFNPPSQEEINKRIEELYTDDTYKLIARCIRLAKESGLDPTGLSRRLDSLPDRFRSSMFKKFFLPILESYQEILDENGTIDFEDMILRPTRHLRDGERDRFWPGQYKYVLVDEFQDISESRKNFLAQILVPDSRLFAVGDDWQSIYRFTGSDTMAMKKFLESASPLVAENKAPEQNIYSLRPRAYRIQETFRTCKPVSDAASEFIQKNPAQIRKSVRSRPSGDTAPSVNICSVDSYDNENLKKVLNLIPKSDKSKGVFILGRKNRDIENIDPNNLMVWRKDLKISRSTIHKSKGLEDDIVVVLGMDSDMEGFPNHWGEDPLVSVFLPTGDNYSNSEDRRVMYVAMTRAREKVFLVNMSIKPSSFTTEVKEICRRLDIKFNDVVLRENVVGVCPKCLSKGLVEGRYRGALVRRVRKNTPPYSIFLGCTNFSTELCSYTSNEVPCPACLEKGETALLDVWFNKGLRKHEVFCKDCDYSRDYNSFRRNEREERY